ncbi:RagB/SusD family nutrient uptake outer membrane protein [Geofilum rhodophaeum]|uniref:RagB/SusD family nutrient uptake outer membrane protein n=1 Tax=Geofilum rhodophaeum TaxID=1965019 RepID=UPI000B51ECE8|nr:RagB/SusD family nutrient uptake outer membrane protein [Geofilum rhodophaeum]
MNRFKLYALTIVFVALGACSDWLYLEPENGITVDEYWQSEQDVHAAVMGCYASLLGGSSHPMAEAVFNWGELRADMVAPFRSIYSDYYQINQSEITPDNGMARYNGAYFTINLCNTVLEKGPAVLEVDGAFTEAEMDRYRGEMLTLRALLYFYLVRTFDEVPLVLEATVSDSRVERHSKASREDLFLQIEADLQAAERLIAKDYGNRDENKGRLTWYALKTIQADVFLWQDKYADVVSACNAVIGSGQFSLVPGNEDWFRIVYVDGNSQESIFELQFSQEKLNPYYTWMSTSAEARYRANVETMEYLFPVNIMALPEDADIRSDGASYKASGGYSLWKYVGADRFVEKNSNEAFSNWIVYRYADVLLMKAEALANSDGPTDGLDALALIEQVRTRANAPDDTKVTATDQYSLTTYIVDERAREFAFEGKRWFDVLRNAKRNNYQRKDLISDMVLRTTPPQKVESALSKFEDPRFHYLPLHRDEIEASYPLLEQNSFYVNEEDGR